MHNCDRNNQLVFANKLIRVQEKTTHMVPRHQVLQEAQYSLNLETKEINVRKGIPKTVFVLLIRNAKTSELSFPGL